MDLTITFLAALTGVVVLIISSFGLIYFRLLDTRHPVQRRLIYLVWVIFNISLLLLPLIILFAAQNLDDLVRLGIALGLALLTAPVQIALNRHLQPRTIPHAKAMINTSQGSLTGLLSFAESISGVVELDELVQVTMRHLQVTFHIERGILILVLPSKTASENEGYMLLKPHQIGLGTIPVFEDEITMSSTLLKRLLVERRPLLQSEVDHLPLAASLTESEKGFFQKIGMVIYVPVVAQGNFIGVLGVGQKSDATAYTEAEVELLMTIANQIGTVLRNARLVDDLRRREKEASEANIALQDAKQQLEHLDGVKTDFITIASHELRTPLAQIRGYTDIIGALNEQGMLDPEQLTSMTDNLRKATDRMEELIRNMLDVSQLDVNAMDLRFTGVTLSNVVKLAIEPLTEDVRRRKLSVSARGLRELPEIQADMKRMVQAFQNVIVNAIKFTPDGGRIDIEGKIQTNAETGGEELLVTVTDTGIGIDKKNLELVFEKFVRTQDPSLHSTGKTKFMGAGPGLGLTIARGVIDGHGGRIWAESPGFDPEKFPGSTFYIILPLNASARGSGVLRFEATSLTMDRTELMRRAEAQKAAPK